MPLFIRVRFVAIVAAFFGVGTLLGALALVRPWLWVAALLWWGAGLVALDALWPCFSLFGRTVVRAPRGAKVIALTFDDGPSEPATGEVLEILKRYGVRATFFVIGVNAARTPRLLQKIVEGGHAIGNHTASHRPLHLSGPSVIEAEIDRWEEVVRGTLGSLPPYKILRTPRGFKNPWLPAVIRRRGYYLIGWTRGIWDTDPGVDAEILYRRATRHARPGEILILHDGFETRERPDRRVVVTMLPRLIEFYKGRGWRFVTVPEVMNMKIPPSPLFQMGVQ